MSRSLSVVLSGLLSGVLCLTTLGCARDELSGRGPSGLEAPGASTPTRTPPVVDGRATLAGISFDVPRTWTVLSAGQIASGASEGRLRQAVEALGLTPEQLVDLADRSELILVDLDTAAQPIADTVSVVRGPGPLASPAGIEHDLARIRAELVGRSVDETGAGTVRRVAYAQRAPAGPDMAGEMLALRRDGELLIATVLTSRRATTTRITEQILDSLTPAG